MTQAINEHTLRSEPPLMSGKTALALLGVVAQLKQGATGVTAALAAQAAKANPDADLIAACARYFEAERLIEEKYGDSDIADSEPLLCEISSLYDVIAESRATTLEGHCARARAVAVLNSGILKPSEAPEEFMVSALLRDLIGEARV